MNHRLAVGARCGAESLATSRAGRRPGQLEREVCGGDHGRHLDEELDHVDDQHAPQPGVRGEDQVEAADQAERLPALEPKRMLAILQAARLTEAMIMQLKSKPR